MNKQVITIIDEMGNKVEAELVSFLLSEREDKTYIVYTELNSDEGEYVDLVIAILGEENGEISVSAIKSDEEFAYAQSLLQKQVGELNV